MAFAALISLSNTIEYLSFYSPLSLLPISLAYDDFPSEEIEFLKRVIKKLDKRSRSERVKALDGLIQRAVHNFEDVIDSAVSNLILTLQFNQSTIDEQCSIYVEEVRQGADSFVETVKKIKEEYDKWLEYPLSEEEEEEEDKSSRIDFGGKKSNIVGSSDQLTKIKDQLNKSYQSFELHVISFVGVVGTGRTTLAKTLFDEWRTACLFKQRVWVSIGPNCKFKEILTSILSQISHDASDKDHRVLLVLEGNEKELEHTLYTCLKGQRYLIVLDDVWDTRVWEYLKRLLPDENNGSRVFLTTHLHEVALSAKSSKIYQMRVLNKEESWNVLSWVLFHGHNLCPLELEKAGKKIAENCKGLHSEVVKVAKLLREVDKTPENWNKFAAEMEYSIAKDAYEYDGMSEIAMTRDDSARIIPDVLALSNYAIPDMVRNVFPNEIYPYRKVFSIVGMAGVGKTAIAREIFDDPTTLHSYDYRVWITLGPKYQSERILVDILAQLDPNFNKIRVKGNWVHVKGDWVLIEQHVRSILLSCKRCLVVLDDVWNRNLLRYFERILPDIKCEVLLTTRLKEVSSAYLGIFRDEIHEVPLLGIEESWRLLRERIFGEKLCPPELEKPGRLIAEKCDGLPLMIVTIARLLSEADDMTPEYWNEVANKENVAFVQAYGEISKVLYPSYKNLDSEMKTWLLYMAAFRLKYEIPISKLLVLYTGEGIAGRYYSYWNSRDFEFKYIGSLSSKSLILVQHKKNKVHTKTCRLHSVFWHFCVREARNVKFLHVINCYANGLTQVVMEQRRLSVQNSVLFAIKDVYNSMASASTVRSLLCFGPPHQYQVPICLDLKLLKVLDALTIRFYKFPIGILKLVLLRYLALTYDGKLPNSISKLWSLEILIIHRHVCIRPVGDLSYLPTEIWDMKELKHLQIMGCNLPDCPNIGIVLDELRTLLDVRAESCSTSILGRLPYLANLGIRIELKPDASTPSFSFDGISLLTQLHSLKCVVVNPEFIKHEIVAPPAPRLMLPSSLRKLSLSGFGYPWEDMRPVALLPNLQELKLKCYAFRGAEWVMHEGEFSSLFYLQIDDADVVRWRADDYCRLQSLRCLIIRHCFRLKDIPWQCLPNSCKTELHDCNPSASKRMPQTHSTHLHSSWEAGKLE